MLVEVNQFLLHSISKPVMEVKFPSGDYYNGSSIGKPNLGNVMWLHNIHEDNHLEQHVATLLKVQQQIMVFSQDLETNQKKIDQLQTNIIENAQQIRSLSRKISSKMDEISTHERDIQLQDISITKTIAKLDKRIHVAWVIVAVIVTVAALSVFIAPLTIPLTLFILSILPFIKIGVAIAVITVIAGLIGITIKNRNVAKEAVKTIEGKDRLITEKQKNIEETEKLEKERNKLLNDQEKLEGELNFEKEQMVNNFKKVAEIKKQLNDFKTQFEPVVKFWKNKAEETSVYKHAFEISEEIARIYNSCLRATNSYLQLSNILMKNDSSSNHNSPII
ncbi:IncA protein [Candidatus Rubidus massiliensis]|nr:IncA protein [Candidatus Rubidus massiliensis]